MNCYVTGAVNDCYFHYMPLFGLEGANAYVKHHTRHKWAVHIMSLLFAENTENTLRSHYASVSCFSVKKNMWRVKNELCCIIA